MRKFYWRRSLVVLGSHLNKFVIKLLAACFNSINFSKFIQKKILDSHKSLVFVIGGAFGFSENVYSRANYKLSISKMTFSHQLIRVIFKEQLYRAFTILKGEKYHNE